MLQCNENSIEGINSRVDQVKEQISELKDWDEELSQRGEEGYRYRKRNIRRYREQK